MTEHEGLIVAAHGRHYLAQSAGKLYLCVTRGKKSDIATGEDRKSTRLNSSH